MLVKSLYNLALLLIRRVGGSFQWLSWAGSTLGNRSIKAHLLASTDCRSETFIERKNIYRIFSAGRYPPSPLSTIPTEIDIFQNWKNYQFA